MSKIDKKSIILILVFAILFTIISPITVKALIEVDPELETSGVTAMVLGNRALLSDGSLWKIESETTAKIEDKGIKAYNFVYSRYTQNDHDYYAKLKNNNTLNVKMTEPNKESSVTDEKNITNVKKIIEQYDGNFLAYLTYTNDLYFLDPYEGKDNIQFNLVAKDVEKVLGQYYIKDGKTYLASGQKVLDKEIDKAYKDYCSVGNTLYEGVYYDEDHFRFDEYATDFVEFENTQNINGWMTYKATDGEIKETGTLSSSQQISKWHAVDGSITYYLSGTNVFVNKSNVTFVLLKNVVDMNVLDDNTLVFVRKDGTVWTNKLWDSKSCSKLISPKVSKFTDINASSWYFNAVNYVVNNNILSGLNATTFGPTNKLTRGMMVSILYKMEGSPNVTTTSNFTDVKDSSKYYYKPAIWASTNKIVSGYKDGSFGPSDNITREQLAVILYKYAKYKGKDVSKADDLSAFSDKGKVASYALSQVKWAVASGVITGSNGKLNPKGNATRAEVAAMMEKYCKKVGR